MRIRWTWHARRRAAERHIPIDLVELVYEDPELVRDSGVDPDREIRSRRYDRWMIDVVVDRLDGSIVSVWLRER